MNNTIPPTSHRVIESSSYRSLTGCEWVVREADERQVLALKQQHDLPELLCRILAARGIACEEAEAFLHPSLKAALPDPAHLLDMERAAERVAAAVIAGERIAIFGDYDVDGATSSALLARFLRSLGADPLIYIPDRMQEGYGPNAPALLGLKERGASVVITVDCGTLAFAPIEAAHAAGLDVIVIDHHQGEAKKPKAFAIVNPNRLDETSPHRQLAAVGVAFLLCVAVNRQLRGAGFFLEKPSPLEGEGGALAPGGGPSEEPHPLTPSLKGRGKIKEPDLKQWLDIVALGTICDVVPLVGVNRALVTQGLKVMAARGNLGMRTIMDLAGVDEKPGVYACGFIIGPRINAGGRVGKSDLGVRLLITEDEAEALALAKELERHNAERKAIEAMVQETALAQAEKSNDDLLIVSGKGWHPGVIGIVAGRLKERFHRPAIVIALENGIGKASARSVSGVDMGAAVIAAMNAGLLVAGGGHAMAAGFTVEEEKIPALAAFLRGRIGAQDFSRQRRLSLDGHISIAGATVELAELLERLGPFGQGNASIRLSVQNVVNLKPEIVGEHHVKTLLIDPLSNARLSAISFRSMGTKLGDALLATRGKTVHIAGQLRAREWNGKQTVSLMIDDIAAC